MSQKQLIQKILWIVKNKEENSFNHQLKSKKLQLREKLHQKVATLSRLYIQKKTEREFRNVLNVYNVQKKYYLGKLSTNKFIQEVQALRNIVQDQILNNNIDWQQVALRLKKQFPERPANAKQCKKKYFNLVSSLKTQEGTQKLKNWNQDELNLLFRLYNQYGPMWSFLSSKFLNKSRIDIKNMFNSCLKSASRILYNFQEKVTKRNEKSISHHMIHIMLNFTNQLHKLIQSLGWSINHSSKIFLFKHEILKLCLNKKDYPQEEIQNLVRLIKTINSKLRSFGVYKVKNSIQWKISLKNLQAICLFDNVIQEQSVKLQHLKENEELFDKNIKQEYKIAFDEKNLQPGDTHLYELKQNNFSDYNQDYHLKLADFMIVQTWIPQMFSYNFGQLYYLA